MELHQATKLTSRINRAYFYKKSVQPQKLKQTPNRQRSQTLVCSSSKPIIGCKKVSSLTEVISLIYQAISFAKLYSIKLPIMIIKTSLIKYGK